MGTATKLSHHEICCKHYVDLTSLLSLYYAMYLLKQQICNVGSPYAGVELYSSL